MIVFVFFVCELKKEIFSLNCFECCFIVENVVGKNYLYGFECKGVRDLLVVYKFD